VNNMSKKFMLLAIKILGAFHADKKALSLLDRMEGENFSLKNLRFSINMAKRANDRRRSEKYARLAVERFPQNTLGYIVLANLFLEEGEFNATKMLLDKAPNSNAVRKIKKEIKRLGAKSSINDVETLNVKNLDEISVAKGFENTENSVTEGAENAMEDFEQKIDKASKKIRENLLDWNAYWALTKILLKAGEFSQAAKLLIRLPRCVSRSMDYYLSAARACEGSGKFHEALKILLVAQRDFPCDHRILLRISSIYRDAGAWQKAYIYTCAAQRVYPKYGTIRKLTFESDHSLIKEGYETLELVKKFTDAELLKFMPMINRVSVFFPDAREIIAAWHARARKALWVKPFRSPAHFERIFRLAVKLRWYDDAQKLLAQEKVPACSLKSETMAWYQRRKTSLGQMVTLLEIAYLNESKKELIGIRNHAAVEVYPSDVKSSEAVELFIPTAFFADAEDEKPSYETIRTFLRTVYDHLLAQPDLIVVPRHQYNWRFCERYLQARALSYHTNSKFQKNWLHVQEATLAGCCSMDHQGFAGYSSLASGLVDIAGFCKDKSEAELEENYRTIYEKYVTGNISKYSQNRQKEKILGRYVFIALQVSTDIVANLAWISGEDLLRAVAEHYCNTDIKVVVKRHPYCKSIAIETTLEELSKKGSIQIATGSVHDLIGDAEIVYTVNSGVGLEALVHMKPLVVTGNSDYLYGAGATAKTLDELHVIMCTPIEADRKRILEFLYYYANQYAIPADDEGFIKNRIDEWLATPF